MIGALKKLLCFFNRERLTAGWNDLFLKRLLHHFILGLLQLILLFLSRIQVIKLVWMQQLVL